MTYFMSLQKNHCITSNICCMALDKSNTGPFALVWPLCAMQILFTDFSGGKNNFKQVF